MTNTALAAIAISYAAAACIAGGFRFSYLIIKHKVYKDDAYGNAVLVAIFWPFIGPVSLGNALGEWYTRRWTANNK